jgi:hypothetical protein
MTIARLLMTFLTFAAFAAARAQEPAQAPPPATIQLPPPGSWADSGLVVAQGDQLRFGVGPADGAAMRLAAVFPPPAYRGRIGEREFPITLDAPIAAPAGGPLQVAVQYPQSPQFPPSRAPHLVMTVTDLPRPPALPPSSADKPRPGPVVAPAGNIVSGVTTPEPQPRADRLTDGSRHRPMPPARARAPDWTLIFLAAAGLAVALGTALALRLTAGPAPAPAVTIDPSLDRDDGAIRGAAVAQDGPEVRLRGALEYGGLRFEGGEPELDGEAGNG